MTFKFSGEEQFFESALIGGMRVDGMASAMYVGKMDLEDVHANLFGSCRAIINMLTGEFNIPFDEVDSFILSAVSEALTLEYNNRMSGKSDLQVHKVVKKNI